MEAIADWRFIAINLWPALTASVAFIISAMLRRRISGTGQAHAWRKRRLYTSFKSVTFLEAAAISLLCFLVSLLVWHGFRDSLMTRTEQINGVVTGKDSILTSSRESYDCNCRNTSPGNSVCETCYRTHYYKSFRLFNSTGDWWNGNVQVENIEYQPPVEPASPEDWQKAFLGMPVSLDHRYSNYIAADGTSPFVPPVQLYRRYQALIPPAPFQPMTDPTRPWRAGVKDKLITIGFTDSALEAWNISLEPVPEDALSLYQKSGQLPPVPLYLDTLNGFLGPVFQSDLYLIFADRQPMEIVEATQALWQRGPKNAIYVYLFGQYDTNKRRFTADNARVEFGVPSNYAMQAQLQSRLLDYIRVSRGQVEREPLLSLVAGQIVQPVEKGGFNRKEMRDYAALKQGIHPNASQLSFSFALVAVIDLAGKIFAYFLGSQRARV